MGKNVHVLHLRWAVKLEDEVFEDHFAGKAEAEEEARYRVQDEESELVIHDRDGKIQRKHSYGNDPRSRKG